MGLRKKEELNQKIRSYDCNRSYVLPIIFSCLEVDSYKLLNPFYISVS